MSTCSPVTLETVLANYSGISSDITGDLRTLVIGPDYAYRELDTSTNTNLIGSYTGAALTDGWPSHNPVTEAVETSTAVGQIYQGLIAFFDELPVSPSAAGVSNGAQNGTVPNEVVHDSESTIWAGTNRTVNVPIDVEVGDYVYLDLDGSGATILETTVTEFKYDGSNNPTVLVLADSLPAGLIGQNFYIRVAQIATVDVSGSLSKTATQVTFDANIQASTTRTGGTPYDVVGGTGYSEAYVTYRALKQGNVGSVLSIDSEADLDTYFDGWDDPSSELGFAVARALAPTVSGISTPNVLAVAVASNDATGWGDAVTLVQRRSDWYALAPLTSNTSLLSLTTALIASRGSIGYNSHQFIALTLTEETSLFTGTASVDTVLVDDSLTPGEDRTVTYNGAGPDNQPFAGAVVGDIATIDGTEYVIESVVSNQVVTITSVASSGDLDFVIHPLSATEQADDYGTRAQAYGSRDTSVVFPPDPTWQSESVPGYLITAAVAGIRGYAAPQQSLVGVVLEDGWSVPSAASEFLGALDDLAAYGVFVLEDCPSLPGRASVYKARTTDQSTAITSLEFVVANENAIRRHMTEQLLCLQGRQRVTQDSLGAIIAAATAAGEFIKTSGSSDALGDMVSTISVGVPTQDSTNLDTVLVPVNVTIPAGLSNITQQVNVVLETIG